MTADWSLRGRLKWRLILAIGLGWLCAVALGLVEVAHDLNERVNAGLESEARMAAVILAGDPRAEVPLGEGEALRVTVSGAVLRDAPWAEVAAGGVRQSGAWHVVRVTRGETTIELGQPVALRRQELVESAQALLALMLPFLAVVYLIIRVTVTRGLAPATRFVARLRGRDPRDLTPLSETGLPRELAPIPEAVNQYTGRIRALIEAERAFASHAAHELRTPIAVASAQAQLIAAGTAAPDAAERLHEALMGLGRTVERLLQLARAEAGPAEGGTCDLVRVLTLLARDAPPGRVRIDDGDLESSEIALGADLAGILFGNLIRNGLEHGTGPVEIRLSPGPQVRVTNPVAPDAGLRPGRFDKRPGSPGSGLGLAIVEAIAAQNGLAVAARIEGGHAVVEVALPPAPPRG